MLIGIFFLGSRSGCRSNVIFVNRIDSVAHKDGDLVIDVRELQSLGPCRAMSWPLQFVEVAQVPGEVLLQVSPLRGTRLMLDREENP